MKQTSINRLNHLAKKFKEHGQPMGGNIWTVGRWVMRIEEDLISLNHTRWNWKITLIKGDTLLFDSITPESFLEDSKNLSIFLYGEDL